MKIFLIFFMFFFSTTSLVEIDCKTDPKAVEKAEFIKQLKNKKLLKLNVGKARKLNSTLPWFLQTLALLYFVHTIMNYFDTYDYFRACLFTGALCFNDFSIIFIHEVFGHYLIAKYLGYQCPKVCVGCGPTFLSKNISGTKFNLKFLPLGGYVQTFPLRKDAIRLNEPKYRLIVASAGIIMNFLSGLMAKLLLFGFGNKIDARCPFLNSVIDNFARNSFAISVSNLIPLEGMDGEHIFENLEKICNSQKGSNTWCY